MDYLAFDIGGSFVKYGIISKDNAIFSRGKFPTPRNSKEEFLKKIKEVYEQCKEDVSGIAVSMPGKIDIFNGYAYSAGVLSYLEETNIVDMFHEFTSLPVAVENDGKCAALAESWFGALKDMNSGIVLVFGTGVGGGIVINNHLHRGHNNISGEFSFILNKKNEESVDSFGYRASVISLIKSVEKAEELPEGSLSGEDVFSLINSGHVKAYKALEEYCDNIVVQLCNLQHIFDPQKFAIGGGISEQQIFIECLKDRLKVYSEAIPYLLAVPDIVQCKFRNDANLLGALANFRINQVKKPLEVNVT